MFGLLMIIALPLALAAAHGLSRQRRALQAVDLEQLSEGDRTRWAAYWSTVDDGVALGAREMEDVEAWPRREQS
jgi:hypothetical protein